MEITEKSRQKQAKKVIFCKMKKDTQRIDKVFLSEKRAMKNEIVSAKMLSIKN